MLFSVLFKTKDDFIDCIKFWITPDIVSMFRGQYFDDHWAEFKLWIWIGGTGAISYGTYALFQ
jgi:hypothetical protein